MGHSDYIRRFMRILERTSELQWAHGVSAPQIATAYAVGKGVLPILGVTKMYQVEEAVKTADIILAAEEIVSLEAAASKSGASSIQFWESRME